MTNEAVGDVDHHTATSLFVNLFCFIAGMPTGALLFRKWLNRHDEIVLEEHEEHHEQG